MSELQKEWNTIDYIKIIPAIIIAGIIVYFPSLPNPLPPPPPGGFPLALDLNTILHICEFAGFAFFVAFGLYNKIKLKYLVSFTILFAFLDEVHQYFVPNRYFDVYDILADIIGVILGFLAYVLLEKLLKRQNEDI